MFTQQLKHAYNVSANYREMFEMDQNHHDTLTSQVATGKTSSCRWTWVYQAPGKSSQDCRFHCLAVLARCGGGAEAKHTPKAVPPFRFPPLVHRRRRRCLELAAGAIIQPGRRKHALPGWARAARVPDDAYTPCWPLDAARWTTETSSYNCGVVGLPV